jgi:hypothetical protein
VLRCLALLALRWPAACLAWKGLAPAEPFVAV